MVTDSHHPQGPAEHPAPAVYAVVVSFNPDANRLLGLVQQIASQVKQTVIVDNASEIDPADALSCIKARTPYELVRLDRNHGIGYAQNVGIKRALEAGADYVILFDHDSNPPDGLVTTLLSAFEQKMAKGHRVAAVGPRFIDERNPKLGSFVKLSGFRLKKITCPDNNSILEVDHLIASGALISIPSLQVIGLMREDLFIDYVDIEWCLRAQRAGYQCFGVCSATMRHTLGDTPITHLGQTHTSHSPLRQYFLFRNRTYLYRLGWIPMRWKIADASRLFLRYAFYTTLALSRPEHWRMMHRGLWDGLRGRLSKR